MDQTTPSFATAASGAAPSDLKEPEIFCPHCGYNLRGLRANRCPECGNSFDREDLIKQACQPNQPLPFGYEYSERTSYLSVFFASLFRPARLGRELPSYSDVTSANLYGLNVRLISIIVFVILLSIPNSGQGLIGFTVFAVIMAILSFLYEVFIAILLFRFTVAKSVPKKQSFRFWRTLCHCFSTHYLCTFTLVSMLTFTFAYLGYNPRSSVFPIIFFTVPAVTCLWWWYCLGRAITQRASPSYARAVIIAIVPLIGPAAIYLPVLMMRIS